MLLLYGGKKKSANKSKSSHSRVKRLVGGHAPSPLAPADFNGLGTSPAAGGENFAEKPTTIPTSKQVGGGYGFVNGTDVISKDVATFGGSYFPVSKVSTEAEIDPSRGGNNFMSGGKGKSWRQKGCNTKGGKKTHKRSSKHKRSSNKRSKKNKRSSNSSKRSSNKRSSNKRSSGHKKMKGGLIIL